MTQNYINKAVKEFRKKFAVDISEGILYWHGSSKEIESSISQIVTDTVKGVREEDIKIVENGFKTLHGGGNGRRLLIQVLEILKDLTK